MTTLQVASPDRKKAEDDGLLEPLAPPDAFAPLPTERLILRPFIPEDAEALHRLVNDWDIRAIWRLCPSPIPANWLTTGYCPRANRWRKAAATTSPSPAAKASTR